MDRSLFHPIKEDLNKKMVLLSGPRQCGKTYLSEHLVESYDYLNFDVPADRMRLLKGSWAVDRDLVIFDELHKMKKWKSWLKGVVDAQTVRPKILVTGSAKMNTYKKVGDSLAGRYFSYRLYPFDPKEIVQQEKKGKISVGEMDSVVDRLLNLSGFPEPYLSGSVGYYQRWMRTHLDVILKQDILETESVRSIKQLETLALLLTERVGSTLSYNSLREDLYTDDKSVKRWVDVLENSYVVFRIYPYYQKSMIGGLKKAPKIYFYDYCRVENMAHRLENLVALSLLKEIHYRQDVLGQVYDLHFLRNKQEKEVDFLITKNKKPHVMIEVKQGDDSSSGSFSAFDKYFPGISKIQLVKNLTKPRKTRQGVLITPLGLWLSKMDF